MQNKKNIDKIGNTLVYLTSKLGSIFLTKAIKLLYLLDEFSVRETGVPFTWLEYKAWKMGPVPVDMYSELREKLPFEPESSLFSKFISVKRTGNPVQPEFDSFLLESSIPFNNDEFTEYDIDLMDRVLNKYGGYSATDLINILHSEGSLWDKVVKDNNLDFVFALMHNRSEHTIPFTDLIKEDEIKQLAYKAAFSTILFDCELI